MKAGDAVTADAALVSLLRRHPRQQLAWHFDMRTPALAFENRDGRELAIIRPAAKRTQMRTVEQLIAHGLSARTR